MGFDYYYIIKNSLKDKVIYNIMNNKIQAELINLTKIYYKCPYCWTDKNSGKVFNTRYFKNGNIAKNRLPTLHHHGNPNKSYENRIEDRVSHCEFATDLTRSIEIEITNDTTKKYNY